MNQALAELDQHLASSRLNAAVADERRRQWEQAIEAAEASMRASTSRTRARLLQWAVALWRVDAARRERGEEEDAAAREAADDDQGACPPPAAQTHTLLTQSDNRLCLQLRWPWRASSRPWTSPRGNARQSWKSGVLAPSSAFPVDWLIRAR